LEAKGLVALPPVREAPAHRGPRTPPRSAQGAPAPAVVGSVRELLPLALQVVAPGRRGPSRLWRELIGRYHYLGERVPVGATLRYFVRAAQPPDQILACVGATPLPPAPPLLPPLWPGRAGAGPGGAPQGALRQ
jgi:hypothetical protein